MKTVKDATGTPYEAPKHFGVYGLQKFVEESERVKVFYSYFQPNGGAEMSASPTEKIYYIVKGSITVNGKDESHVLNQGDLIFNPMVTGIDISLMVSRLRYWYSSSRLSHTK